MNKWILAAILMLVVVFLGFRIIVINQGDTNTPLDTEIFSRQGIHLHPNLEIYIKGQKQDIPSNIGVGSQYGNYKSFDPSMQMTDIHTHEPGGILHWEIMKGPVTKDQIKLGGFFTVWAKAFNSEQIFDNKNGQGGTLTMTVNGQPNTDFENYLVKDKDQIIIRFE